MTLQSEHLVPVRPPAVFEGVADFTTEDGGRAGVLEVSDDEDEGLFVRLQTWYEHPPTEQPLEPLAGKRLRITIEEVPDE